MTDQSNYKVPKLALAAHFLGKFVGGEVSADASTSGVNAPKTKPRKKRKNDIASADGGSGGKPKDTREHVRRAVTFQKDLCPTDYQNKSKAVRFVDNALHRMRGLTTAHRWSKAAYVMPAVMQFVRIYPLVIWKVGNQILLNNPHTSPGYMNKFANNIVQLCGSQGMNVTLDHMCHLIGNGDYLEATQFAEYRPPTQAVEQIRPTKSEKAYKTGFTALAEYLLWVEKSSSLERIRDKQRICVTQAEINVHFVRACDNFELILKCKGNLDVFVEKYTWMLQLNESWQKVNDVYKNYMETNKIHPTPYAMYYTFLKDHGQQCDLLTEDDEKRLKKDALKKLITKNRGDHRVMELFDLLDTRDFKARLRLIANLVDLPGWRSNLAAWNCLTNLMLQTASTRKQKWRYELRKFINDRTSYWSPFHFGESDVLVDNVDEVDLSIRKAIVATVIYGRSHPFVKALKAILPNTQSAEAMAIFNNALKEIRSLKKDRLGASCPEAEAEKQQLARVTQGTRSSVRFQGKPAPGHRSGKSKPTRLSSEVVGNGNRPSKRRCSEPSIVMKEAVVVLEQLNLSRCTFKI